MKSIKLSIWPPKVGAQASTISGSIAAKEYFEEKIKKDLKL